MPENCSYKFSTPAQSDTPDSTKLSLLAIFYVEVDTIMTTAVAGYNYDNMWATAGS